MKRHFRHLLTLATIVELSATIGGCSLHTRGDEFLDGQTKEQELFIYFYVPDEASLPGKATLEWGTGFPVSEEGLIVTADHIFARYRSGVNISSLRAFQPGDPSAEPFEVEIIASLSDGAEPRDLAFLKPKQPRRFLAHFPVASDLGSEVIVGDPVVVSGFPLVFTNPPPDRPSSFRLFARYGAVSSLGYPIEGFAQIFILDMTPVDGFSGAPVINRRTNRVIGVFTGGPSGRRNTAFSVASRITDQDLRRILGR